MKARPRIRSWISMILAWTCLLYSVPPVTVLGAPDEWVDFAKGLAYETNWEDSEFNGGHEDFDHTKLTDDATATSIWGSDAIHFRFRESGEPITFTFDLGQPRDLHLVEIIGINGGSGVETPTHYQVEYFDEAANNWVLAGEENPTSELGTYDYLVDLPGAPVKAQQIRISVTPYPTFLCLTDIKIWGKEGEVASGPQIPSITKNLPSEETALLGDLVTLSVEASVSDGGVLSYQWMKDGEPVGENSPVYTIDSAALSDSGSYQVKVTNTLEGETADTLSKSCTLTVSEVLVPGNLIDFAKGLTYETNWKDSEYNGGHEDPDHTKLTDDATATSIWSADAVHYCKRASGDPVTLTFDLTRSQTLYRVEIIGINGGYGVMGPTHYQVEYFDETANDWVLAGEGNPEQIEAPFTYTVDLAGAPVKARQVRVSITPNPVPESTYLCLTDVRILGVESGPQTPALTKNLPATTSVNADDAVTLSVEASVSDGGVLSYQWYRDGDPVGTDSPSYTIETATLADSGNYSVTVTNTLNGETNSVQSALCALTVIDMTADAVAPVIHSDLFSRAAAIEGDAVTFEIAASATDGGTLSYQWYKDGDPIGENSPSYAIAAAALSDSGEYWVVVTNTKGKTSAAAESNICVLTVNEKLDNLIAGIPYATELADANYHESYPDLQRAKMTDGVKATGWNDANSVGIHTGTVSKFSMEFDLDETISFQQVNVGMLQANDVGISYPAAIQVERKLASKDEWDVLYNGNISRSSNGRFEVALTADDPITADQIRITVTGGGSWAFLDEIEVFAKTATRSPYGKLVLTGGPVMPEGNNLALGKPYTANHPADTYTDTDGKELTDGKYASVTVQDPAWVGYNFWHDQGKKNAEVILDLEQIETFQEIRMNILRADGVAGPSEIHVYISNTNGGWQELKEKTSTFDVILDLGSTQSFERVKAGFLKAGGIPSNGIFNYVYTSPQPLSARYVKVEFVYDSWVFLDEIEVLKDPLPREAAQPEQAPAEIIDPDPNNIAFGCDYEAQWSFMPLMPDNGRKLTDGRRGAPSPDANEWAAYNAYEGAGGYKSFNAFQSQYPTAIKVEYSDDKVNWKDFTGQNLNWSTAPSGIQRFDYGTSGPVTGRYVKLTMTMDQVIALDEIEVLKTNDGLADAELQPDNGQTYNLISGYDVTLSRTPNMGSASLLTDGFYGDWTEFDSSSNASDNHIAMNVDLTSFNSVSQILLHTKDGSGMPQNVVFKVSADNVEWFTLKTFTQASATGDRASSFLWQGGADSFYSNLEGAAKAYIRYLRVEFDIPYGKTVSVDEIEVVGKRGKCSDAGLVMNLPGEHYNVALGKPYTATPANVDNTYPDTNGIELTDGIRGTDSLADPAWFGFKSQDYVQKYNLWPLKTIVVDLEDVKTITSLQFNMKGGNKPWRILTFASMDGERWTPLSENRDTNIWLQRLDSFGWHFTDTNGVSQDLAGADMVACRYVRIDIEICNWNTIDEIEIMGYDGIKDGALIAEGGRDLENGQKYLVPSEETTGGIHDLVLCYNGWYGVDEETGIHRGDWSAEQYKPYLTYVDYDGKSVDTMFDGVLLLGLWSQYGRSYTPDPNVGPPQIEDWIWYYEKIFKEGGDIDNLNEAARQASIDLGDPNYKVKLVLTIPEVHTGIEKFGTLNGREMNLTREEDWKYLIDWWLDMVIGEMERRDYEYIDFSGIYWLAEGLGDEVNTRLYAADIIHEAGYHFYWIPYFFASGTLWADKAGFDAVALQPNHFFEEPTNATSAGAGGTTRVDNAAKLANYAQIGLEMEFDNRVMQSPLRYNQYLDYLNSGVKNGFDGPNVYRAWYQDLRAIYPLAYAKQQQFRDLYDYTYQFMKGTLTNTIPYIEKFSDAPTGGSIGQGSSIGGGGSGGGGYVPSKPGDKPDPETPPTGDDTYTWEETDDGYKLTDKDGEIVTGWAKVSGKWYYLNADGIRTTGWQKVDNKWYYLKSDGVMATGWLKLGNTWYFLSASGVMQTGWLYNGGVWYYLYDWGGMANSGWVKVGNTWYYFRGNGAMFTGWLQQGTTWYYLKDSGAMATGWNWVNAKCYYFNASGKMAANTTVGGYKLDASGAWVK
ncbi:DUF4855 domain-containing protein [Fumia xinanensis]|uniref:DUF4855 domain-containing protein n=1 Tax=Fumia xinanensis TaxID=2763659 RepID=A0A926E4E3_9FIRM|nr:DUF4855 domain-containing protein [Fumia xinanensis]MBC8559031.1 DUF4855 domain-containing protein [Fumia xinanensis]